MNKEEDGLSVKVDGKFVGLLREMGLEEEEIKKVANSLLKVWAKQKNVNHEKEIETLL